MVHRLIVAPLLALLLMGHWLSQPLDATATPSRPSHRAPKGTGGQLQETTPVTETVPALPMPETVSETVTITATEPLTWTPDAETLANIPTEASSLLRNGSFEGGFHRQSGIVGEVPDGWNAINLAGNPTLWSTERFANGGWVEKIDGVDSVLIGAEDYFPRGLPFETVYYQTVDGATPGKPYSFTGWVQLLYGGSAWPDNNGGKTVPPDPQSLGAWIGIDPTGGTNPRARTVEWGMNTWENFAFINLRTGSLARNSRITVFVRILSRYQQSATTVILDGFTLQPAPQAVVQPLPTYLSGNSVMLRWQGILPPELANLGNFALYYDVQRQRADGSWQTIANDLTATQYQVAVTPNTPITLRVLPKSWQPRGTPPRYWPPSIFVGVPSAPVRSVPDTTPPATRVTSPLWTGAAPFEVRWSGSDVGAGVKSFDVEWRLVGGGWQPWLSATTATRALFGAGGQPRAVASGQSFEFRVRARDQIGNVSAWAPVGQSRTNVATVWLTGRVLGNRGEAIPGATIAATPFPYPDAPLRADGFGRYLLPLPAPGNYTVALSHAGRSLPATPMTLAAQASQDWLLPPPDNVVVNGTFEGTTGWSGSGWQRGGLAASGTAAAQLAPGGSLVQNVTVSRAAQLALAWRYTGTDRAAQLRVNHGPNEWRIPVGASSNVWRFWFQPTVATGNQPLRLSLIAANGSLAVDDVSLGSPQPPVFRTFLPYVGGR